MTTITIGGESFDCEIEGPDNAPALMLSNSLGTSMEMWDPQVVEWQRTFRVLRYDSRGHGKSVAPDGAYTIDELGNDALAIMNHFHLARVNWCGVSMGGMVGQWLLCNAPERLDLVVLANTAAFMGPPQFWDERIRLAQQGGMPALVDGIIDRWFTPAFRHNSATTVTRIRDMILATPPHGYAGCCAAIRDMDQRDSLRSVKKQVLVIVGSKDQATPPEAGNFIVSNVAGARSMTLDAAHLSNIEQPIAFAQAVANFLLPKK